MADGFHIARAWISVEPDLEGFEEKLKEKLDAATAGMTAKARVSLDTSELDARVDEAKAKVDELDSTRAEPSVHLNDENLSARADEAHAKLDELDNRAARPDVGLDASNLDAHIEEARAKIEELDNETADPRLDLDTAEFDAKIDEAKAKLAELDADTTRATAGDRPRDSRGRFTRRGGGDIPPLPDIDDGGDGGRWGHLLSTGLRRLTVAGDQGGSFLGGIAGEALGFLGEHKLAAGLVGGATALLPGLAGAGTGLGLLGAAGALGFGGIAKAVEAGDQARNNPGIPAAQQALTNFSNSVAVQNAQQQITSARQQAAQDAITSAQSIESAQMNLASVQRNSAEQQVQALQSVKQAEQGVEEANYSLSEAQYNLNQAWENARENLRQLNDQLADSKLSVEAAKLAVQQAEYQQKLVDQNAYSTALDKQQAALSVAQAQQQVKDATDQLTAAQYKADLANKEGVAGSQQVIQAKQGLIQAQYGQSNAQAQYANAQRELTLTELNNAQQIKQARLQLAAVEEQAAFQRRQDAQNVANAEQNLTDTLKSQQLQQAATKAEANQAATQFTALMGRLSPAAQGVVNQILGMRGAFRGLQTAAQNAIAPGVSAFFKGLQASMPAITSGLSRVGRVLGGAFASIGQALQSPAGAKILEGLINNGVRFAQIVVPALGGFAGALARVGSQKGAVDGIANLIGGLAGGLSNVVTALAPFTGSISSVFTTLGKALGPVGTLLGGVVGQVAKTLAPMLKSLLPVFQQLVGTVGGALTSALSAAAPGLQGLLSAFAQLLPAINPLITILSAALAPVLKVISGSMQGLAQFVSQNISWLQPLTAAIVSIVGAIKLWSIAQTALNLVMEANPFVLIGTLIAGLIGSVVYAYNHFKWFHDGVQTAFSGISTAALWLWHNVLDPMWHGLETGATWLWTYGIKPLWDGFTQAFSAIETAATWLWHNVFDPLWHGIEQGASAFISAFQTAWNGLETVFKVPVNFLIDPVYKNIHDLWNGVVEAVGLPKLDLPVINKMADGGPVTGGTPGTDSVPALLMPGERVLSVPQVAKLGGQSGIDALVGQAQPTYRNGVVHAGGGWSWNPITDVKNLIGKTWDLGKIASAVLTGNNQALSNALDNLVGTNAAGNLGKMLLGIPTTLINKMVGAVMGLINGGSGGGGGQGVSVPGHPTGTVSQWFTQGAALAGVPITWIPDLETIGWYESGWNPNAINLTDINAQNGDPSRGIMQEIMSTFLAHHVPGTSMNIYDPVANIASASRYIQGRYGDVSNVPGIRSLAHGGGYVGYDNGGIANGIGMLPKYTPLPERVLNPHQTERFDRLVEILERMNTGGNTPATGREVNVNFYGTQYPNSEQMAAIQRSMALALSGA